MYGTRYSLLYGTHNVLVPGLLSLVEQARKMVYLRLLLDVPVFVYSHSRCGLRPKVFTFTERKLPHLAFT